KSLTYPHRKTTLFHEEPNFHDMKNFHIKLFNGHEGFACIDLQWERLVKQMTQHHFYHLKEWYASYLEALELNPNEIVFCIVYESENPVAILPLKRKNHTVSGLKIRTLELPRHNHMHLRDILICDAVATELTAADFVDLLRQSKDLRWDALTLLHCPENSCAHRAFTLKSPPLSLCMRRFGSSYAAVQPWEQFIITLSKSFRQNLRTAHNRAVAIGDLRIEVANTPQLLDTALSDFLDIEASGWKGEGGTAIKQDKQLAGFYKNLTQKFAPFGGCEIHILKIADKAVAGLFLLIADKTVYIPKLGYKEEFSRISPVHLLLENLFKLCHEKGMTEINLTSDAAWFNVWKPQTIDVHNIYLFNRTLRGMIIGLAMRLTKDGSYLRNILHWFARKAR
ncbi:MAG: GNAT family N-acetyltransferase, partial [Verrucomicrobiota bacterium]